MTPARSAEGTSTHLAHRSVSRQALAAGFEQAHSLEYPRLLTPGGLQSECHWACDYDQAALAVSEYFRDSQKAVASGSKR